MISTLVRSQVIAEANHSFWSLIADETRDISKREQLTMCVRYVHKAGDRMEIRDEFLSFTPLERLDAQYVADVIMQNVDQMGSSGII